MKRQAIGVLVVLWALGTPAGAHAQGSALVQTADPFKRGLKQGDFPRLKQLAPGIYSYEDLRASDPGTFKTTVDLIVIGNGGVIVADGQGSVAATQKLVDHIKSLTPQPVKYVLVGSEHGDHTGGNAAFKTAYPEVVFISSPVSQKAMAKTATPVSETVTDKRTISLGDTEVQILNLGRAHTGGDLTLYVPRAKVLFMSEVYTHRLFPSMRTAYPSEWLHAVEKGQTMNAIWYVGGHGFVDDAPTMKRELEEFRKELVYVIAEAKRLHDAKAPCNLAADANGGIRAGEGSCEAAAQANWGPYADWSERESQAPVAIMRVYQELDGKLK